MIEKMIFNNDVKESLNKMAKHSGIKVEYYNGFIVMFDRVNIHALNRIELYLVKMKFIY